MFPAPTFSIWCIVVELRIIEQTGRPLCDAPHGERELLFWWGYGIPARVVGDALAWKMGGVPRATFTRFYTDQRVQHIQESMIGRMMV